MYILVFFLRFLLAWYKFSLFAISMTRLGRNFSKSHFYHVSRDKKNYHTHHTSPSQPSSPILCVSRLAQLNCPKLGSLVIFVTHDLCPHTCHVSQWLASLIKFIGPGSNSVSCVPAIVANHRVVTWLAHVTGQGNKRQCWASGTVKEVYLSRYPGYIYLGLKSAGLW